MPRLWVLARILIWKYERKERQLKFPHYPHQKIEFEQHRESPARALLWQQRTGKSKAMIDFACDRILNDGVVSVLCIAPNGVHYNWVHREIPSHKWDSIKINAIEWASSSKKVGAKVDEYLKDKTPVWFSLNSESLMLDRVLDIIKRMLKRGPAILIVDESHDFRTPGAKRTKRLRSLARHFKYRRILTGTPIDNSPFAAYSQFEILEPGALGQKTYGDFKNLYGEFKMERVGNRTISRVTGYRHLDLLKQKISEWASVVGREGLPLFVHTFLDFELPPPQKKLYDKMKKEFLIELESGKDITAVESGARMIKLQQILSGFIIDDKKDVHYLVHAEKNARLQTLLLDLKKDHVKTIIWCSFKEDIKLISEALIWEGILSVEYHGGVKAQARQESIERFMTDPKYMVFLGQPKAGGTGINLSKAEKIIWYSHVFDAIDRGQASERATVIGGHKVALVDIVAVNTIDQYILQKLMDKKSIADEVIRNNDIKEFLKC